VGTPKLEQVGSFKPACNPCDLSQCTDVYVKGACLCKHLTRLHSVGGGWQTTIQRKGMSCSGGARAPERLVPGRTGGRAFKRKGKLEDDWVKTRVRTKEKQPFPPAGLPTVRKWGIEGCTASESENNNDHLGTAATTSSPATRHGTTTSVRQTRKKKKKTKK